LTPLAVIGSVAFGREAGIGIGGVVCLSRVKLLRIVVS
jgi:hypothetical protein